jgi:hypothetical protein
VARRSLRRTFRPSAYTTGVTLRTPHDGIEGAEYGFIVSGPVILSAWALKKAGVVDETTAGAVGQVIKTYWWAFALSVPLVWGGVNRGMDLVQKKRESR